MSNQTHIKVVQTDLIENEINTIFNGNSTLEIDSHYEVKYKENNETDVHLKINKTTGSLSRISENETMLNFDLNEITSAYVKSEAGLILMEVKTHDITLSSNSLEISYDLLQQRNTIASFKLKMEW